MKPRQSDRSSSRRRRTDRGARHCSDSKFDARKGPVLAVQAIMGKNEKDTTRLDRCGGDKALEARSREPRTHSFRHQGALRRFQRDPAPRSGRPAIKNMFQSKRIDEFGAGRAALRRVLLEVASIRCTLGIICMASSARSHSVPLIAVSSVDSKHHIARSKRCFPVLQARKRHSSREPRLAWARHSPKERKDSHPRRLNMSTEHWPSRRGADPSQPNHAAAADIVRVLDRALQ